ncbi:hypothetical protein PROFUN_12871 [Planoprotostelium fungivorum]|uniref:Uncharacterized protein n=1 Tax=Planoprotostelium fungivorum TaxID=1890364 RepID=A0A2P6N6D8_9EUKA|nr:hypothetical protein PROFUN_12871 [Planoprotostelium fungivorum]
MNEQEAGVAPVCDIVIHTSFRGVVSFICITKYDTKTSAASSRDILSLLGSSTITSKHHFEVMASNVMCDYANDGRITQVSEKVVSRSQYDFHQRSWVYITYEKRSTQSSLEFTRHSSIGRKGWDSFFNSRAQELRKCYDRFIII